MGNCKFCNLSDSLHNSPEDTIIHESDNFYAIASIGGFIEGWTLVFPKKHVFNLSNMYIDLEFREFVIEVLNLVEEKYGKAVVFEHGSSFENSIIGCGVNHAHLHIVPFQESIENLVKKVNPEFNWIKLVLSDKERYDVLKNKEYLFCCDLETLDKFEGLYTENMGRVSQYFRKLLIHTTHHNPSTYDYKKFKYLQNSYGTINNLLSTKTQEAI